MTECLSSISTSILLTSVITATSTALLATVIFVLVQIAVCKCLLKHTRQSTKSPTSTEEERHDEYEHIDREHWRDRIDPVYMNTGAGRGMELK